MSLAVGQYPATYGTPVEARIRIEDYADNPRNYNGHTDYQIKAIAQSLKKFGQVKRVGVWRGVYVTGHATKTAALSLGWTEIDALIFPETWPEQAILAWMVADNETARAATPDDEALAVLLQEAKDFDAELLEAMAHSEDSLRELINAPNFGDTGLLGVPKDAKPNPRKLPIDVIYTLQGADATCCLAVRAGLKYGIQSPRSTICPYCTHGNPDHAVAFIDNEYTEYNHDAHLAYVKEFRPKYATVRDVMTREQCREAGIEYYPLEQVLDWAAELSEFAENVIVIPKYDCISLIPAQYMLGYSVPTSHGGTPLPTSLFKGRRVHLLGGSWKAQLAHMADLGESVVSLDNNYIAKVAGQFGGTIDPDGNSYEPPPFVNNIRYTALAIAFGAIGAKINELYGTGAAQPLGEVIF